MSSVPPFSSPGSHFQSAQPRQGLSSDDDLSSSDSASPVEATSRPQGNSISLDLGTSEHSTSTHHSTDSSEEDQDPSFEAREPSPIDSVVQDDRGVPSSTYLKQIAAERELATSLDALTAQDLSIHSFNAFALKRRARIELQASGLDPGSVGPKKLQDAKGREEAAGRDEEASDKSITYEQVGDLGWRPPNVWTAWPMRPEYVPREQRKWEEDDTFESLRSHDQDRPSAILSDLLVGAVLKTAKERLRSKGVVDVKQPSAPNSRQTSPRSSTDFTDPVSAEDVDAEGGEADMKPVMMADEERANSILQPSISQILRNLDQLLMNMNSARASYATPNRGKSSHDVDGAASEPSTSNAETSAASSRRKRRRPSSLSKRPQQDIDRTLYDVSSDSEDPSRNTRSRKRQRTASPTQSASRANSASRSRQQSRATSRKSSRSARPPRKRTFGLLDWSTVLGMASLSNFPQQAVLRASERCADIFGEGMSFRVLHEDVNGGKDVDLDVLPGTSREGTKTQQVVSSDIDSETSLDQPGTLSTRALRRRTSDVEIHAMHGAVHTDNYLQPIVGKDWWGKENRERRNKNFKRQKARRRSSSRISESERKDLERLLVQYRAQEDLSWPQITAKINEELESSYSVGALRNRFQRRRGGNGGERRRSRRLSGVGLAAEDEGERDEEGVEGGDGDGSASESEEEGHLAGSSDEDESSDDSDEGSIEEDGKIGYGSGGGSEGEPQERRATGRWRTDETGTEEDTEDEEFGDEYEDAADADIENENDDAMADDAMSIEL